MRLNRRTFLASSASAALAAGWDRLAGGALPVPGDEAGGVLVDGQQACALRESLRGYDCALREAKVRYRLFAPGELQTGRWMIVPGVARLEPRVTRDLLEGTKRGGTLVLESGGGFAEPREFRACQSWLEDSFGVRVESPVDLWRGTTERSRIPYVHFCWPVATRIRDFSRILPVSLESGEAIAWTGGRPVALRRRIGRGTLIFLGSPLGPALYAGDREARGWLSELLAEG